MTGTLNIKVFDSAGHQVDCGIVTVQTIDPLIYQSGVKRSRSDTAITLTVPSDITLYIKAYIDRAVVLLDPEHPGIWNNTIPCSYNFYHTIYNGTVTLTAGETKNKSITLHTVPLTTEMGYDEITFNGIRPVKIDSTMNIPTGSPMHFLWGVANFTGGSLPVTATVNASITSWDGLNTLWANSYVASQTLSYLDDMDLGPIDFNLPAGISGWLNVNLIFTGINIGTITYDDSNIGRWSGFKVQVGVNPNPTPPARTGIGEAQNFQWSFDGVSSAKGITSSSDGSNCMVVKPGAVFNAGTSIACKIMAGSPDTDQVSSFWALLVAKDLNGTAYWSTLVRTPYQTIGADYTVPYSFSYTLPSDLLPGTLKVTYGGDAINKWQAYGWYNPCKNLISNGGFDIAGEDHNYSNTAAYWSGYNNGNYRSTTYKRSGVAGASAVLSYGGIDWMTQNVSIKKNITYKLSGWVNVEPGHIGNTYLNLRFLGITLGVFSANTTLKDGQWHYLERTFTLPSSSSNAYFAITNDGDVGNTKRTTWDDISLMPASETVVCDPITTPLMGGYPSVVQDTQTFEYTVQGARAGIDRFTPLNTIVKVGERISFDIWIENVGSLPAILGGMVSAYDPSNNLLEQTGVASDNVVKNPSEMLVLSYAYDVPLTYTGNKIKFRLDTKHWI